MDNGYIQGTSSDTLKSYIFNEPVVVEKKKMKFQLPKFNPKTTSRFSAPEATSKHTPDLSVSCVRISDATNKPISFKDSKTGGKDEIFVDIFERIRLLTPISSNIVISTKNSSQYQLTTTYLKYRSITFHSNGNVLHSSIDGTIQMKSYLSGNPELKLALNEDLTIGETCVGNKTGSYGSVEIDDCNFHGNGVQALFEVESSRE
eukprot:287443-Amorphochlora_amoeboformis.AAC.4